MTTAHARARTTAARTDREFARKNITHVRTRALSRAHRSRERPRPSSASASDRRDCEASSTVVRDASLGARSDGDALE